MGLIYHCLLVFLPDMLDHFGKNHDVKGVVLKGEVGSATLPEGDLGTTGPRPPKCFLVYIYANESVGLAGKAF
jgi:hypothetical protein